MIFANNLHGDYQLANGYGHNKAEDVLMVRYDMALRLPDKHGFPLH